MLIAGGIAALCAASAAHADTIDLTYLGNGNGRVVHITLGGQSRDVFAGRLLNSATSGTGHMSGMPSAIVTFRTDLFQSIAPSHTSFAMSSVATLSGNTGLTNLGFGKQQAIYDLYRAAANREFTLGLDYATAFQVAIWEVVYDYNAALPLHGLNIESGTFRAGAFGQGPLSASILDKVHFLFNSVGSGASSNGLMGLRNAESTDELFSSASMVPLPLGVWAALPTLAGAMIFRHFRRRR